MSCSWISIALGECRGGRLHAAELDELAHLPTRSRNSRMSRAPSHRPMPCMTTVEPVPLGRIASTGGVLARMRRSLVVDRHPLRPTVAGAAWAL